MIYVSRTPTIGCRCGCGAKGTEGSFIGSQLRRGGPVTWYCPACWEKYTRRLRAAFQPKRGYGRRRGRSFVT